MYRILRKTQLTLCHLLLSGMVLALLLQIVGRSFNAGMEWTEEMSRFAFISFVFISGSYSSLMKADLRIGVFADWLGRRVGRRVVEGVVTALLLLFDLLMVVYCVRNVIDGIKYPSVSPVLGFNTNYLFVVLVLAFILSALGRLFAHNGDGHGTEGLA
ncbi:TRAP transporter small permease [Alloalcanivorax sp. C16-2]|uniref:TRAP transporter small permease n=1 Tax=Alloalcanivorax TaxID=3020832 RepID=UPI0019339B11|nr:TRAP transporter small permease subunit [Alloalcanivorax marinus]MBL7251802.1 TRAP transporter small permease subunit [Alloalcanivorax marinus]